MRFIDNIINKHIQQIINSNKKDSDNNKDLQISFKWKGIHIELSGKDLTDIAANIGSLIKNRGESKNGKV